MLLLGKPCRSARKSVLFHDSRVTPATAVRLCCPNLRVALAEDYAVLQVSFEDGMAVGVGDADVGGELDAVGDVEVHIGTQGDTFKAGELDCPFVVEVAGAGEVGDAPVATADAEVVVLNAAGLEDFVHPVGAFAAAGYFLYYVEEGFFVSEVGVYAVGVFAVGDLVHRDETVCIEHFGEVHGLLYAVVGVELHLVAEGFSFGVAAGGGDEHYAVGSARSVDGGCRSVLEDFDGGDVRGIEVVNVSHWDAVHYVEGVVGVIDCADATDADGGARTGGAALRHDHHAGGATL